MRFECEAESMHVRAVAGDIKQRPSIRQQWLSQMISVEGTGTGNWQPSSEMPWKSAVVHLGQL